MYIKLISLSTASDVQIFYLFIYLYLFILKESN
jgi:hypothetical protein